MMGTPRDAGTSDNQPPELADLAELQATDALLDRLASRAPDAEDLTDPVVVALAGLATDVDRRADGTIPDAAAEHDQPEQLPPALARLVRVLDGRPLWDLGSADLAERDDENEPLVLHDPSWDEDDVARASRLVIDLTAVPPRLQDGERRPDVPAQAAETIDVREAAQPDAEPDAQPDVAPQAEPDVAPPTVPIPLPTAHVAPQDRLDETERPDDAPAATVLPMGPGLPRSRGGRPVTVEDRWLRTLKQLSVPAAAAAVLLAIGGVSAAVTGDPMATVNGVKSALSGENSADTVLASARQNLADAKLAAAQGDFTRATQLISKAKSQLKNVPGGEADVLEEQLADIEHKIITQSGLPIAATTGPNGVSATGVPVLPPETTSPPAATAQPQTTATTPESQAVETTPPEGEPTPTEPVQPTPTPDDTETTPAATDNAAAADESG